MAKTLKNRLDSRIVELGLAPSRSRAQAMILAGVVQVDGKTLTKAGCAVSDSSEIVVRQDPNPYVSRGGLKLKAAIEGLGFDPKGLVAIDVGASTGGFTDYLLQRGATRVYAVDVGYGQLAWKLRQDPRVVVCERCNARHLSTDQIPELCDLAVADVSFISFTKIVGALLPLMHHGADVFVMLKPQFEADRGEVGKGGVVRDQDKRLSIIERTVNRLSDAGLVELGRMDSPVHGPKGNIECFVWFRAPG